MSPESVRDVTPLAERLGVLQATRVVAAVAVLGVPALTGNAPSDLLPLAVGYACLTALLEAVRRLGRRRAPRLVSAMLLADGAFLATAVTLTGGARSPLLFLMFLDVLAVTLLASYRSGLKVALWCALLLFLGQAAVRGGLINAQHAAADRDAALGAVAFLAVAVAAAIFSATNERVLRDSRARLAGLVDLDAELERARTPDEVASVLAHHATARLGFSQVVVVNRRSDGWVRTWAEGPATGVARGDEPTGRDCDAVRATSAPLLVRRLDPDDTLAELLPDAVNVVVAGLLVDGERLGVCAAEWGSSRLQIPAPTVEALVQAAAHAALALRLRGLLEEVERLATRDGLTGLANRRFFDDTLQREVARSRRTGEPVTLIAFDLDRFKELNDRHGHPAGDAVLRSVAEVLESGTKGFDLAARVGGDEFMVLLPRCDHDDATGVVERLRREAAATVADRGVSVSAGVATLPDDALDGDALVAAADAALYAAKRAGRARAVSARRARAS